jgi:hypothetical protein
MRVNGLIYYCTCGLLSIFVTHWLFWGEMGRRLGVYHGPYLMVSIFLCLVMSFFVYIWFEVGSRLLEAFKCIAIVTISQITSFLLSSVLDVFSMRNSLFVFNDHVIPLLFLFPLLLLKGWVTMIFVTFSSLVISPLPKNKNHKTKEAQ